MLLLSVIVLSSCNLVGHALAQEEAQIRLFEDFSGEIVNGTKHFGFTWIPSEGNETLLFEGGRFFLAMEQCCLARMRVGEIEFA